MAVMNVAQSKAKEVGDEYVSTEHLLVGLADSGGDVAQLLKQQQALPKALVDAFAKVRGGMRRVTTQDPESTYKALEKYGVDLTDRARRGELDPVIGRDNEIRRVVQVLSRRTKNNPVLIGEPGVGKTAVVEGLAQRVVDGDVPGEPARQEHRRARPRRDGRRRAVPRAVRGAAQGGARGDQAADGQVITFLDELHTVVGRGKAEGSMDAGNMLKPMLARGELRMVGATTLDEYRTDIEKDPALERRFQQVLVGEPRRGHSRDPARPQGPLRGRTTRWRSPTRRWSPRRRCRTATSRRAPAGQGDRPRRRGGLPAAHGDRQQPVEIDELQRALDRMRMEELALERETDAASQDRQAQLRRECRPGRPSSAA
jgi:ATP-dependent Clp protease ATP-binding subunit ClpB